MAKQFDRIEITHQKFIEDQHMFFVGSAAAGGRVNISPKGMDSLRVLGPNRIIWLNHTGSGNETAGHLLQINRLTLMWCSFTNRPMILRTYGQASTIHYGEKGWDELAQHFDAEPGARQIFDVSVEMVQTSCGYAVPFMEFRGERQTLRRWTEDRGEPGIRSFWQEKNRLTIDNAPTQIVVSDE